MPLTVALSAMGTRFEFVVADELAAGGGAARRALAEAALETVAEVDRRISRFRRDGLPAALARAGEAGVRVTRDELVLFELCRRAHAESGGAFDPAISSAPTRTFASVRVDRRARRVTAPAGLAPLDFGAVAKGFALDLAACVLADGGVDVALLQGGTSSVVALGAPPGRDAWCVALRGPARPLARVALRDAALSVSAPHGRTRVVDGRTIGHVVDPRDGTPVERVRLVAVVARHGATAEVASTALLIHCERALRAAPGERAPSGASPTASCVALLPPHASALVAYETAGALAVEVLGSRRGVFTDVVESHALAESTS